MPRRDTHKVSVEKRKDGKWDLKIAHVNGNQLMGSSQGYENRKDAVDMYLGFVRAISFDTVDVALLENKN